MKKVYTVNMERIVVLPFSMGCVSHSSIQVSSSTHIPSTKSKSSHSSNHPQTLIFTRRNEEDGGACRLKNIWSFVSLPKANVSYGIQKLVTTFKSFSRFFDRAEEEEEIEMEIGLPTDVKHVTHIGWDGSTINNHHHHHQQVDDHDHLAFPSISLEQFQLAMAAQSHHHHPQLHVNNN